MKIALLGYGKEGKAAEEYFRRKFEGVEFTVFENLSHEELAARDYSEYGVVLRSPSVRPLGLANETSLTRYFFDHCPCPIIGVTATKGKGTTCSFIKALLEARGEDVYLVGNIGVPAIEVLDKLTAESVVVYEMSSFQLWDMTKSPHVAVIGVLEPDHLNVHKDYAEYLGAKANITKYQTPEDYLIYNRNNAEAVRIAEGMKAKKVAYPFKVPKEVEEAVKIPGRHNIDNAIAAIGAVASYLNISPDEYLRGNKTEILQGLAGFKGLPHRLEFVRELEGVQYYDDNFATNAASMKVAVEAFPDKNLVVIVGGRDKTDNEDIPEIYESLKRENVRKIVLMGESGHEIAQRYEDERFIVVESLAEAVKVASEEARKIRTELDEPGDMERLGGADGVGRIDEEAGLQQGEIGVQQRAMGAEREKSQKTEKITVVLMSPAAASFDMFKDVYDRGAQYQELVRGL